MVQCLFQYWPPFPDTVIVFIEKKMIEHLSYDLGYIIFDSPCFQSSLESTLMLLYYKVMDSKTINRNKPISNGLWIIDKHESLKLKGLG